MTPSSWQSFWDVISPESAAEWLLQTYGAAAGAAAAHCALAADSDGRRDDFRFWSVVIKNLKNSDTGQPRKRLGARHHGRLYQ